MSDLHELLRSRPARIVGAVMAAVVVALVALVSSSGAVPRAASPSSTNGGTAMDLRGATGLSTPQPGSTASRRRSGPPEPCTISAELVKSCAPWVGAAAYGNPGAPANGIQQFTYLETLLGHHLTIFRDYHNATASGPIGSLPLNAVEKYMVAQPNTYLDINWKPAGTFAAADGGDARVNADIARVADSIKSVAPHKIFLTVWVEPQNDVSGGTNCPGLTGKDGTPAQYRQMWANVESIFRAQGADNVIWTMDYQSDPHFDCLVPQLWPGNNLVDWVLYDSYDHDNIMGTTWANTVGRFYHTLEDYSSPSVDIDSKPWGLGEFNTCENDSQSNTLQYFEQARQSIEDNTYPRLKMYIIFATMHGGSSRGCLTNYAPDGQLDEAKSDLIKALFNLPLFNR